jgi:uncharacterized membrane protein YdbT with pleckstrin-like domain
MTDNPYLINVGKQVFCEIGKNLISFFIALVVLSAILFSTANYFTSLTILMYIGFFIVVLIITLVYNLLLLNSISYSITNTEFSLKGGIIARFEKVLPYSKIQHSIITRSFMQRIMGLSTLVIQTASPNEAFSYNNKNNRDPFAGSPRIPGLNAQDTEKLRDYIISQVLKSKSGQGI